MNIVRLFVGPRKRVKRLEGVVEAVCRPGEEWVVRVNDVYWHGLCVGGSFVPGDRIEVVRQEDIKLIIAAKPVAIAA